MAIGHWVKSEVNGLGSPIQLCQGGGAGPIIFCARTPSCIRVGGPLVVAIGRRLKSEKLGSPIQLCLLGPAKGVLSFFALECWVVYFFGLVRRGSPIQLCIWEPAKGVRRVISFLH